jgi:hypothetical protein
MVQGVLFLTPNKPDAPNPAIALPFHFDHHWRRVGDPEHSGIDAS